MPNPRLLNPDHKCQQYELYGAEGRVDRGSDIAPEHLQSFLDTIREHPWFERNFPTVLRIEGYVKRGNRDCSVGWFEHRKGAGVVDMLPEHLNELTVLHEVSHVLAHARYGSHAHDPWFARIYLEAVYTYLGSDTYDQLQEAFRVDGIDADTNNQVPGGIEL